VARRWSLRVSCLSCARSSRSWPGWPA
jgi:hypothetical protein